ncbi:MAG: hypothetical protein KDD69_11975 [Bdellovibrionales bacterium]|nr:hypothetical protein [Bdellovibrionales bacterium]
MAEGKARPEGTNLETRTLGAREPLVPLAHTGSGVPKRTRLPVMPLAVLLPSLSDVSTLPRLQTQLEKRLQALQEAAGSGIPLEDGASPAGAAEPASQAANEESMLNQVLQWLAVERE